MLCNRTFAGGIGVRVHHGWHKCAAVFAIGVLSLGLQWRTAAAEAGVTGSLDWPTEWTVFAPIDSATTSPEGVAGSAPPQRLELADGTVLKPIRITAPAGERIDFKEFFPEQKIGNVAWLYTTIESPIAQTATIGVGADWWFTAWLNGSEILSTPPDGNSAWPPTPNDFTADVQLVQGRNYLVVRYITGGASALFAAGGPSEISAVRGRIGGTEDLHQFNREVPFFERMPFEVKRQAFASAEMDFVFPAADVDFATGALAGLEPMPKRQLELQEMYGRPSVGDTEYRRFPFDPVKILLSKSKYPIEDQHLDVVLWTSPPEGMEQAGSLEVVLKDADGKTLSRNTIDAVSDTGWFFAIGIPPQLEGRDGSLEVIWWQDGKEVSRAEETFSVLPSMGTPDSGSVPIQILNAPGAIITNAPMTVGVPFPHGALHSDTNVRLLDDRGKEVPLQTRITGRWSRFGPIKWLLCDFTASLDGSQRTFTLEFGPDVERSRAPSLTTGRLKIDDDGIQFDADGSGNFTTVLGPNAFLGEYVRHEDGRHFTVPADVTNAVEVLGSEKVVIRRTGWYTDPESGDRFCNFITRLIFHRDSPVVRIYHTWVFTGDSNQDRIRDMGWRFEVPAELEPEGFLSSFDDGVWLDGQYIVQYDYDKYALGSPYNTHEGRTPGVLSARVGDSRVLIGVKDFWQNFPSELSFADGAIYFHNWPRHNVPAFTPSPVPAGEAFRLRFAHEGEVLNFRMPDEYADGAIYDGATLDGREELWERGNPESVNAQGVARTEEIILYFTSADVPASESIPAMQGFNDESLRAIADPVWMTESGAFGRIHYQDWENYPQEEELYLEIAHAPARWNERLGAYGMWVHGDFPADNLRLREQTSSPRRTWKKGHHGWPYKWTAFVRSGDPELLKYAESGSRQMVDAGFRHFVDPETNDSEKGGQGWTGTSLFPWLRTSLRSISQDVDYLWHNYYLTGFPRTVDVAQLWMELVKLDTQRGLPGRISVSQMYYYLDTYMATFDPWFLVAAYELAGLHRTLWDGEIPDYYTTDTVGHFWKPSDYNFYNFTGNEDQKNTALRMAMTWSSPWAYTNSWNRLDVPFIEESAAAWFLTGDEYHLGRVAAMMDSAAIQVFDGPEPEYLRGSNIRSGGAGTALELFTGWYIQHFPYGLYAFENAGVRPDPIPQPFFQRPTEYPEVEVDGTKYSIVRPPQVLFIRSGTTAMPIFFDTWRYQKDLTYDYMIASVNGDVVLEGQWTADTIDRVDLPQDTPPGLYSIQLEALDLFTGWRAKQHQFVSGLFRVPATPHYVPEVLAFPPSEEGTAIGPSLYETQYWFQVPESVGEFWVRFEGNGGKIWNPDGEVVWSGWDPGAEGDEAKHAVIRVKPEFAGQLWRITYGGANPGLVVDPAIPPYFSVSRAKWFNPDEL